MNTNGGGSFANNLFSISNATMSVQNIDDNGSKMNLPYKLSVPEFLVKDKDAIIKSNYLGSGYGTPFIVQKNYENGGELFYVNIYPIVQAMQKSNDQSKFYALLGKFLDGANIAKLPSTTPLPSLNGYVKQISLKNNTQIETTSMILPSVLSLKQVEVKSGNSSNIYYNVTSIMLNDYSNVVIKSENAIIQDGNGFYTELQLNSTFSIKPSSSTNNLKVTVGNETYTINNIDLLSVTPSNILQLQVRTPTVSTFEVTFVEFYLQNYPQMTTEIYGQNLRVTGSTMFSIIISDNYQQVSNLTLGSFSPVSLQTRYDLLSTLPTIMLWSLLLFPVFLVIFFIFKLKIPKTDESVKNRRV
jgi:hypothetical protein